MEGQTRHAESPRVLVVDDEALVRWSVAQTLTDEGYEVSEASDAAAAVRALSGAVRHLDLLLLDLRLPDADDLRVLSAARRLSPDTQVIIMTAYANPELLEDARRLGAFAVVSKPFDMDDLAPLMTRALSARPH